MPQNVGPATYSGRARAAPGASIENPCVEIFGVVLAHLPAFSALPYALPFFCNFDVCARFVLSEILAAGVPPASVGPLCARPQPRCDDGGPNERRSQGLGMCCGRSAPPVCRGRPFRAHQRPPSIDTLLPSRAGHSPLDSRITVLAKTHLEKHVRARAAAPLSSL